MGKKIDNRSDGGGCMKFYAFAEGHRLPLVKITQINKLKRIDYDSAIIDVGIYELLNKYKDKPFPIERIENTFKIMDSDELDKRWLIATGDYPALNAEFGQDQNYDNVKLTRDNWEYYSKSKNWKQGIYTLQSHTISNYDQIVADYSKFPLQINGEDIPYIGVGSLCRLIKNKKEEVALIYKVLKFVRERYPKSHIHVWGLSVWHIDAAYKFIDSFDSTKWTKPHNSKLPHHPCKNKEERKMFFDSYLHRIKGHVNGSLYNFAEDLNNG